MSISTAQAIGRLADAQFQQAKAMQRHNKLIERQVEASEEMLEMHRVNLRVSQHLEAELATRAQSHAPDLSN